MPHPLIAKLAAELRNQPARLMVGKIVVPCLVIKVEDTSQIQDEETGLWGVASAEIIVATTGAPVEVD